MSKNLKIKLINGLKHYLFDILLIWLIIYFYRTNGYYESFLRSETQTTLFYLAIGYTIFGLIFYIVVPTKKINYSKGLLLFRALIRIIKDAGRYLKEFTKNPNCKFPKIKKREKTALLFLIVKIFFLPLMLNFFFSNYHIFKSAYRSLPLGNIFSISIFNSLTFPVLLSLIFLIDTLYFAFGYTFESELLKNKIRSVEPTIFGWAVALISYPPFNSMISKYVVWSANDYLSLSTEFYTFMLRISIILFLIIYLSATIALGTKCSNLTNRGIVIRGPYRFVRHPAYISKNLAWWITVIPVINIIAFLSMLFWSVIYYHRAITEERHLLKDPDYQEYCKKVKYKFIPYVW